MKQDQSLIERLSHNFAETGEVMVLMTEYELMGWRYLAALCQVSPTHFVETRLLNTLRGCQREGNRRMAVVLRLTAIAIGCSCKAVKIDRECCLRAATKQG